MFRAKMDLGTLLLPVVGVLFTAGFAGCLGMETLDAAGQVLAPVWQTGNTWTWDVLTHENGLAGDLRAPWQENTLRSGELTHRVVNAGLPLEGRPRYLVQTQGAPGIGSSFDFLETHIAQNPGLLVIDKATLDLHATARLEDSSCGALMLLHQADPAWPVVGFPLQLGATHTASKSTPWTWPHLEVQSSTQIGGKEQVVVPAGSFDAIRIDVLTHARPSTLSQGSDDAGSLDAAATLRVWYAPEARNIVRSELLWAYSHALEGESVDSAGSVVRELTSFDLGSVPEGFVPGEVVRARPAATLLAPQPLRIVADRALPLNQNAAGDTTVTFGLARGAMDAGTIAAGVPAAFDPPYDDTEYTLRWSVQGPETGFHASGLGKVFTVALPEAGRVQVEADLVHWPSAGAASDCRDAPGAQWSLPLARADSEVYWAASYSVHVRAGGPASAALGSAPLAAGWAEFVADYEVRHNGVGLLDEAFLQITQNGVAKRIDPGVAYWLPGPGEVQLEWVTEGASAGKLDIPPIGHTASIGVLIRYGDAPVLAPPESDGCACGEPAPIIV